MNLNSVHLNSLYPEQLIQQISALQHLSMATHTQGKEGARHRALVLTAAQKLISVPDRVFGNEPENTFFFARQKFRQKKK